MRTKIAYGILGIMFVLIVHFMSPISVLAAEMWNDEISQDDVAAEMWNDENSQDDVSQADVQSEKSVEETSNIGLQEKNEQSTKEKVNMSQGDAPQGDVPQGDASQGDMPQGDAPQGDMPQGDAPQGDMPQGDTPQGDIPKGTQPVENGPVENGPEVLNVQTSANNPKIDSKLQYVLKHASEDEYIVVVIDLQAVDEDAVRALLGDAAAPSEALESAKYVYAVIAEAFLNRYFSGEGRDRILSQSGYSETVVEKIGKDILGSYRTVVKYTSTITVRAKKSEILAFAADSQVDRVSLYDDSWVPESVGVLNEAKATAKVELSHYKDLSKYREAQQKEIQLLVDRGLVAIDNAEDVETVRSILKKSESEIDKVKTHQQLLEEEAKQQTGSQNGQKPSGDKTNNTGTGSQSGQNNTSGTSGKENSAATGINSASDKNGADKNSTGKNGTYGSSSDKNGASGSGAGNNGASGSSTDKNGTGESNVDENGTGGSSVDENGIGGSGPSENSTGEIVAGAGNEDMESLLQRVEEKFLKDGLRIWLKDALVQETWSEKKAFAANNGQKENALQMSDDTTFYGSHKAELDIITEEARDLLKKSLVGLAMALAISTIGYVIWRRKK